MAQNGYNLKAVLAAWRGMGLPLAQAEFQFHVARGWKFDFAWPEHLLAVEVQGGIWASRGARRCPVCHQVPTGRHNRGAALKLEWEKLNTAATMGWRIFYCEPREVTSPQFVRFLKAALTCR